MQNTSKKKTASRTAPEKQTKKVEAPKGSAQIRYDEARKKELVELMLAENGPSANELAKQVEISQPTLSRWLREAKEARGIKNEKRRAKRRAKAATRTKQGLPISSERGVMVLVFPSVKAFEESELARKVVAS